MSNTLIPASYFTLICFLSSAGTMSNLVLIYKGYNFIITVWRMLKSIIIMTLLVIRI